MRASPIPFPLVTAFGLLLVPLAELHVLHAVVVDRLGPNNTRIGFYARDVLLPGFFGLLFYLSYLLRDGGLRKSFQPRYAAATAAFLGATLLLLHRFDVVTRALSGEGTTALLLLGVAATLLTGAFCFVDPRALGKALRGQGARLLYAVGGLACLAVYARIVDIVWRPLAWVMGEWACVLLRWCGVGDVVVVLRETNHLVLHHSDFSVQMAPGCAGIEGVFFFLFFYALVRATEKDVTLHPRREAALVALGVALLFALNLLRIVGMVAGGVALSETFSRDGVSSSFAWLVHNNVSWAIYAAAMLGFFAVRRKIFSHSAPYTASTET